MTDQTPETAPMTPPQERAAEIARGHIKRIDRELRGIEAAVNVAWDECAFGVVASFGPQVDALNAEREMFAAILAQPKEEHDADE